MCSTSDLFADETKPEWREAIFDSMLFCPTRHTFQLLTKKPQNINKTVEYPDNFWFGVTVSTQSETWRIDELRKVNAKIRFVSFEPLLGAICPDLHDIQWVIVGKLTGSNRVKLKKEWLQNICIAARCLNISLFMKNNLREAFGSPMYLEQEFPRYE